MKINWNVDYDREVSDLILCKSEMVIDYWAN